MQNKRNNLRKIEQYYRDSNWLYKYFWYSKSSLGLNHGLWKVDTKNRFEAINNNFQYVIDRLKIAKRMKVLDAGCGVGGGSTYIAQKTGAKVVGISISPTQIDEAKKHAINRAVDNNTEFWVMDYTETTFPDNYFDVVFGIESVCYAYPKSRFLKEVYRILKPGGKLMITDGYCQRLPKTSMEKGLVKRFCEGWKLEEMMQYQQMTKEIIKVGFKDVSVEEKTEMVKKSFGWMRVIILISKPLLFIKVIGDNVASLRAGIEGVESGLFGYFTHMGTK